LTRENVASVSAKLDTAEITKRNGNAQFGKREEEKEEWLVQGVIRQKFGTARGASSIVMRKKTAKQPAEYRW
jgi:hypothetical protein